MRLNADLNRRRARQSAELNAPHSPITRADGRWYPRLARDTRSCTAVTSELVVLSWWCPEREGSRDEGVRRRRHGCARQAACSPVDRQGHDVVGMTRTQARRDQLRSLGVQPVVADALDADAVGGAVGEAEPDVIVHQLTAIPPKINMRRFETRVFASPTDFARRAPTTCCRRAWRRASSDSSRRATPACTPAPVARSSGRTLHLTLIPRRRCARGSWSSVTSRAAIVDADWTEGIVLRYGWFYGPGTSIALVPLGSQIEMIPQAPAPHRRRGQRHLVLHPHRGRRHGNHRRHRGRTGRYLQRRRRRTGTRCPRMGARAGGDRRCEATAAGAALGWAPGRRRVGHGGHDRDPRRRQRQDQARPGRQLRYPSWRQGFAQGLG